MCDQRDWALMIGLFRNIARAWNRGDGKLYASYFTEDCDYVTFHGQHLKGRDQVAASHQELFDGLLRNSQLCGQITAARYLSANTILVHQTGGVKLSFQKDVPKSRMSINSNLLVLVDNDWQVASFHNCRIQGPGIVPGILKLLMKK